jgi:hypothetical protein
MEFNLTLLGKWCWQVLTNRGGRWFRVLAPRYGVEWGRLRDGGRRGSSWWREIVRIRDGVGGDERGLFGEAVTKKVGDETNTLFSHDP